MIEYFYAISVVSQASVFAEKRNAHNPRFSPVSLMQNASLVFSPSTLSLHFREADSSDSSVILNGSGKYLEILRVTQ